MSHVCDRCGGTLRVEIEQPTITDGWLVGYLYPRVLSVTHAHIESRRSVRTCRIADVVSVCESTTADGLLVTMRDGHQMAFSGDAWRVVDALTKYGT